MKITLLVFFSMFTYVIHAQQQQQQQKQFSNVVVNNSNLRIQSSQNNSNKNLMNVAAFNNPQIASNQKVQSNKTTSNQVRVNRATVHSSNRNNTTRVVRQNTGSNSNRVGGGPNASLSNFSPIDNNNGNTNEDKIVTNALDNNVGNQFNPQAQVLENNNGQIQTQQAAIPSQSFVTEVKENKSLNLNLDLSVSKKSFSSSSGSSSSVKANRRTFHKKYHKFKRNFYGKLTAHKKSRHQVDICFNWR